MRRETIRKILDMYKEGYTCAEIAKKFKIGESTVRSIVSMK